MAAAAPRRAGLSVWRCIVLTSRPVGGRAGARRAPAARTASSEMKLTPLRPAAIASLVERVLGDQSADAALVDEIIAALGRQSAVRARVRAAADDGFTPAAVRRTTRAHGRRRIAPTWCPVTVRSLIASRLDALPPSDDLALKAASVIGDGFTGRLIAGACLSRQIRAGSRSTPSSRTSTERQLIARRRTRRAELRVPACADPRGHLRTAHARPAPRSAPARRRDDRACSTAHRICASSLRFCSPLVSRRSARAVRSIFRLAPPRRRLPPARSKKRTGCWLACIQLEKENEHGRRPGRSNPLVPPGGRRAPRHGPARIAQRRGAPGVDNSRGCLRSHASLGLVAQAAAARAGCG